MNAPLRSIVALGLSLAWLATAPAGAQQDPDTSIRFSLSPPGARSLALGGAFLALADDATAAYTNPAGLTNLTLGGSEVAVELRQNRFASNFADRGHFSSVAGVEPEVTGKGVDIGAAELLRGESKSETSGISFLSFAYVLPRGLTLALYGHELANFRSAFRTQGPFVDQLGLCGEEDRTSEGLCPARFLPRDSQTELEIVNTGLSAAYELELPMGKGRTSSLSFGAGASYYQLELQAENQFYDLARFSLEPERAPGAFYGPPDYAADNLSREIRERGDDDAVGFNVGVLWKLGEERHWSLGAVFRQGARFETAKSFRRCSRDSAEEGEIAVACEDFESPASVFTVPDVFGLGVAWRGAEGKTKITFDWNRVRYSQRLRDFTTGLISRDDPDFDPVYSLDPAEVEIADADQLHLGIERVVLVVESLFVGTARFGAWREPYHELEYMGSSPALATLLRRKEEAVLHYSLGFGLVIKEDYQLDLAAEYSDVGGAISFSLVKFL